MTKHFLLLLLAAGLLSASAQSPVIMQPANQTTPAPAIQTQNAADDSDILATLRSLGEMKAANDDLLKKQQTVLDALDQLQKDAEQLRIYAKRG